MSAIEQPAPKSGKTTVTSPGVRMSALSAMKCTPQKTTYFAPRCSWACWASLKLSPVASACRMTSSAW
jgi:hypothetical protein